MPDTYYPEGEEAGTGSAAAGAPAAAEDDAESSKGETALLPKSLVGDVNVGDQITLTVEKVYENEVEVCPYKEEEEKANQPAQEPSPDMTAAEGKLESMAE